MKFVQFFKKLLGKAGQPPLSHDEEEIFRQAFKTRGDNFKLLLSANKRALEAVAGMEEAMRGSYFFSLSHVRAHCTTVTVNVYNMIKYLNVLTGNREHKELFERWKIIQERIQAELAPKVFPSGGPLVISLDTLNASFSHEVGDKMASLGEASQKLGRRIPAGFVVTASGFRRFVEATGLHEEIPRLIQMTDLTQLDAMFALSERLQALVLAATIPQDLEDAILGEYKKLVAQHGPMHLAVRSSAIGEDSPGVSFAGQYRSELNITGENLLKTYKLVVASKYCVTAMSYRLNRGIPDDEVPMCVGCMSMVQATSGGVVYSQDPTQPEGRVVINAVPGLPKAVVDGTAELDVFHVSRTPPYEILEQRISLKKERLLCSSGEGIIVAPVPQEEADTPSLTPQQVHELATIAMEFEAFYGMPQDIEWAYDQAGTLILLQSRPLQNSHQEAAVPPPPAGHVPVLEKGVCASLGVCSGPVVVVRRDGDMVNFPKGGILLVEQAHSRWAPVLSRASGVISELGGTAGHLASVAREYGIPALFGVEGALEVLQPGQEVTLEAAACRVYAGKVDVVLARETHTPKSLFAGSPVYTVLAKAMSHIAPLHLLYPESPTFAPAYCETMHDITRYCHEKAVEEMFRVDENLFAGRCGKQLRYKGSKLQYFVVNLGAGFCSSVEGKYLDVEKVCSMPMLALWQGMIAVPWAGPPAASVRGFFSVMAESASNPDLEITSSSMRMTRNYFMIDKEYCNLQASFGYHFCTVEAQTGQLEQENYVSFHFKGGAANMDRRRRRVHMVADVLAENGFIVDVKEDAVSARAEDLSAADACTLLAILGYLIIHTRQMDASLHGEDARNTFADLLRKGIAETLRKYQAPPQLVD
ncbi:PEP/pyruvate-binding domain-containing protein [Desulfovibrio cuneatus]|uniref:PEP/pyruvate-binding domain-containing protein n=1 Tax=Desulfovibrio cuneatus TaxID=159728 RepID=UPI00041DAB34|nr:PEP/pyruvate-binding domain-containing protein [Desulfovibrio cuneatus]